MLTPDRWQQVKLIVEQALEYPPAERAAFILARCGDDQLLLKEINAMLAQSEDADNFLELPAHRLLNDSSNVATLRRHTDELITRPNLQPGFKFLGKYELLRIIGRGGMGQVYQARHIELKTMVAIKVLHNDLTLDDGAIERFKREALAAAKLEHANIVRVFDYGVDNKNCYLIMEYLAGESLRERLGKCRVFPLSVVLQFTEQVCQALTAVHQKGIIHRDLKPENIFFHQHNQQEIVKLLDFGIAKMNNLLSNAPSLTNPGDIFGTPHYMAPEQCQAKPLDARADIYALGVILYEMLAGRKPIEADNPLSLMYAHVHTEPIDLAELALDLPSNVAQVVMKTMSKNPSERYQSAAELWQELINATNETTSIQPIITSANSLTPTLAIGNKPETINIKAKQLAKRSSIESSPALPVKRLTTGQTAIRALVAVITVFFSIWLVTMFSLPHYYNRPPSIKNVATPPINKPTISESISLKLPEDKFALIMGGNVIIGRNSADCNGIANCKTEEDEQPAHQITLAPYYLGKYEVTNREYQEFITATKYSAPLHWKNKKFPQGKDDLPVTNVSWNDVAQYCQWRAKRDGIDYRLPTEAEWEHAARGEENNLFPWGNNWNDNYAHVGVISAEIGLLPVNYAPNNSTDLSPYGIYGMAGNASEWTASDFTLYPGSIYQLKDRDLICKVYRGGNFNTYGDTARTTIRSWVEPNKTFNDVGFRLAVTAK